jgi:ParB-like chromosome segregation protein Spo0J
MTDKQPAIPFDAIIVDPEVIENPRRDFGDVEGLSFRIKTQGLSDPIGVWFDDNGDAYLADGMRRYLALETLLHEHPDDFARLFPNGIPYYHLRGTRRDANIAGIVLDVDRKAYTPAEMCVACETLARFGLSPVEIATTLGVSTRHVQRLMKLKKDATSELMDSVHKGDVSIDAAYDYSQKSPEEQKQAADAHKQEKKKGRTKGDVTKKRQQVRRDTGRKSGKKTVKQLKEALEEATAQQEEMIALNREKPTDIQDIVNDGANAGRVVTYTGDVSLLQGRIDALEWALGEREELR